MSPELKRNLWLEFTPSRVAIMTGVIALAAFAVFLLSGRHLAPLAPLGVGGFVIITLFWGTRNAARSVIGEIRERTWDFQRISAVRPVSMALGKLFGATSYTWYGGLLCLLIAVPGISRSPVSEMGLRGLALLVASGVLAHSVAMGSALATARRRRADARLGILPHQAAGLAAAYGPIWAIGAFGTEAFSWRRMGQVDWFGASHDITQFALFATVAFAAWAILGCWREMRLELMERNAPVFWPLFLGFLAIFLAGFGDNVGQQLAIAYGGLHAATMVSLLVEPKNAVELRAFGAALVGGRLGAVVRGMPAFAWAFAAAAAVAVALQGAAPVTTIQNHTLGASAFLALLGFLARDVGVFLFFHARPRQTRGDFAGLVALALLYVVGGALAGGIGSDVARAFVAPSPDAPAWAAILPWLEAALVGALAVSRFRGARRGFEAASARALEA